MKTLTLEVPDNTDELDVRMTVACKLYVDGELSIGKAANVAGVTYRYFVENMGRYGASLWQHYTEEDLLNDLKNA
jgi:predicted HTH domain antitoxin